MKKPSTQWSLWASKFAWADRATAFDRHLDEFRTAAKQQAVTEVAVQRQREIELSALSVLKETTALAKSSIADVLEWDEKGTVTRVVPSKELPE